MSSDAPFRRILTEVKHHGVLKELRKLRSAQENERPTKEFQRQLENVLQELFSRTQHDLSQKQWQPQEEEFNCNVCFETFPKTSDLICRIHPT